MTTKVKDKEADAKAPETVKMHLRLAAGGPKEADVHIDEVGNFEAAGWKKGALPKDEQGLTGHQGGKGPEEFVVDSEGHRHSVGSGIEEKAIPSADLPPKGDVAK